LHSWHPVWQLCKEKSEGEHLMTAKQWAAALMVVSGLSGMMTAQAGWWSGGEARLETATARRR
jgi:hypothetical protein